jgi:PEP-CTERM motif
MRSRDFVFAASQASRFIVPILSAFFISMAAGPVKADTFTYSFTNVNNAPGTDIVTGTIILDPTDTFATSLTVDSNTGGFGLGQYVGNPTNNSFTVVSGNIATADFIDHGASNSSGVTCCTLRLFLSAITNDVGLTMNTFNVFTGTDKLTFTPAASTPTPVVPLPATLPLFATGLGALGLLGWRRKKKAAA